MATPPLTFRLPSGEIVRLLTSAKHIRAVPIFFPELGLDWTVEVGDDDGRGGVAWRAPLADEIVGFAVS